MKKFLIIFLCVLLFSLLTLPAYAFDDGDLQLWNTESAEVKINDSLKIKVEEELRFGDDISELYYTHTDGGFDYKVTDGLYMGLSYRHIYTKVKGEWKYESRPHADGTLKWTIEDFKFSDRSRLELRCPEDKSDTWRYRNKLTVEFPWKWTEFEIQPYVADEIFIPFHGKKFSQNRLYAGFKMKIMKNLKAELFYLWQSIKSDDDWTNFNVLGIKVKAVF
ncbi:MAG: DUF2490 domain-containing protein [Candidatus Omnitrophota bacterium]